MGQAIGQDRLQFARQVARQGVAHLDRRRQFLGAVLEHVGQVLPGVLVTAEEQGHLVAIAQRHHARREQPGALVGIVSFALGRGQDLRAALPHQLQDLDGGVIVVQHLPLGRLPDQFLEGRGQVLRDRTDDVPLGRGRQRNLQVPLQVFEAIEGEPAAIFEEADHAAGRGIILLTPYFFRCRSREHLAAQVATQLVQLIDVRRQRRLPDDPHHHAGSLVVDRALAAGGTGITGLERRMPHVDPRAALVSVSAIAPWPGAAGSPSFLSLAASAAVSFAVD